MINGKVLETANNMKNFRVCLDENFDIKEHFDFLVKKSQFLKLAESEKMVSNFIHENAH